MFAFSAIPPLSFSWPSCLHSQVLRPLTGNSGKTAAPASYRWSSFVGDLAYLKRTGFVSNMTCLFFAPPLALFACPCARPPAGFVSTSRLRPTHRQRWPLRPTRARYQPRACALSLKTLATRSFSSSFPPLFSLSFLPTLESKAQRVSGRRFCVGGLFFVTVCECSSLTPRKRTFLELSKRKGG